MKNIDVAAPVMRRIVSWERRRISLWVGRFLLGISLLIGGLFIVLWLGTQEVLRRQTLELLAIFWEDPQIIEEFWQDTLNIVIVELPWEMIAWGVLLIGSIGAYFVITAKARRSIQKKKTQLTRYETMRMKKGVQL